VDVSNYSGTTVSISRTKISASEISGNLVDTPGIYSMHGRSSDDEMVTKKILNGADLVINVVNALTLERDLLLTLHLLHISMNVILVVNQIDEAEKRGFSVDAQKLSQLLGIRVIKTVATRSEGTQELLTAIGEVAGNDASGNFLVDPSARPKKKLHRHNVDELAAQVMTRNVQRQSEEKIFLDRMLLNPYSAWPIALLIFFFMFKFLGIYVAGDLVDYLSSFFDSSYEIAVFSLVTRHIDSPFLRRVLLGDFGILTMEAKTLFVVLLPLVTAYNAAMSLLEDSGYLPRLTVLTDNFFSRIGLNGKAVIPILLGFGCSTMGILSTRMLETKKDRTIATAIIGIAIPCAAQQGIIIALLSSTNNVKIWLLYIFIMLAVIFVTGKVLDFFLRSRNSHLLMDIPPLRAPSLRNCLRKTLFRSIGFIRGMLVMFTVTYVIMTVLNEFHVLYYIQNSMALIIKNMLNLPRDFANIFVIGMIRKDVASASLLQMSGIGAESALTSIQILTATVVISLFVPCVNALIVIFKERGWKEAVALWFASFFISVFVGWLLTISIA
jgi:ferrous iron transport protein B